MCAIFQSNDEKKFGYLFGFGYGCFSPFCLSKANNL
jgi:hypothetical protein